jgi:Leucine-rich repeat (LRR) protein
MKPAPLACYLILTFAFLCPAGTPPELVDANWIVSQGGSVTRDNDGHVTGVNLRGRWVTDGDLERLAEAFPDLESLDLSHTHVTDLGLGFVAKLSKLENLNLYFAEHVTESGVARLAELANLETLNLRGARMSDSGMEFLSHLANLRELDVGITQITDTSLEHLEGLAHLEKLALGGNRIGQSGLIFLQFLPALKHLDLSGAQITDSGVWSVTLTDLNIKRIATLEGLEVLNLAAADNGYVAAIGDGVPRLRNRIQITDLSMPELRTLPRLRSLDLSRSEVTAKGLTELAALPKLENIVLAYCEKVDDSAARALLDLKALRSLDLSHSQLTDGGLALLEKHGGLKNLYVSGTAVTPSAVAHFRQHRPDCRLSW